METTETNARDHHPDHAPASAERADDPIGERPMSIADIEASYAEHADLMHRFEWFNRVVTGRFRRRQFGDATGDVLDVACGTGTNFRYLPADVDLVGIDISTEMLSKARETLSSVAVTGRLRQMDAQDLSFPDDSFDTVISALSTCTFPDPVAALQEMERVCRPDGRILLVEHGLSDVGSIARYQKWRADTHYATAGCQWTQEPLAVAAEANLNVTASATGLLGIVTRIEATPGTIDSAGKAFET